jgi:hypothetical protein
MIHRTDTSSARFPHLAVILRLLLLVLGLSITIPAEAGDKLRVDDTPPGKYRLLSGTETIVQPNQTGAM